MLKYFGALDRRPIIPIVMTWEDAPMFTIRDAAAIAADLHPCPTGPDVAAVLTDGIADGMLPDEPRYWQLARIAARLPVRTVRRLLATI